MPTARIEGVTVLDLGVIALRYPADEFAFLIFSVVLIAGFCIHLATAMNTDSLWWHGMWAAIYALIVLLAHVLAHVALSQETDAAAKILAMAMPWAWLVALSFPLERFVRYVRFGH